MVRLRAQQLALPCVCFKAKVRRGEGAGRLTPIERITLKAIGAGITDVTDLARALRLGKRPILDLIYDFWQKGYLIVDTDKATVQLTGVAAEAHREGRIDTLFSAENNDEDVALMQELVSGAVLPSVGRRVLASESMLVPTERTALDLGESPNKVCLDAIRRANLRDAQRTGRALNVLEAWIDAAALTPSGLESLPERRYLQLLVDVIGKPRSDALVFEIIDAPELPPVIRRDIELELAKLANRFADRMCFRNIRARIASEGVPGGPTPDPLTGLSRALHSLEATDPGLVEAKHDGLVRDYRASYQALNTATRAQAVVHTLIGDADHDQCIARMLRNARHQVILGNPWLDLEAMLEVREGLAASWFDLLEQALARGVRIALLWGIKVGDNLNLKIQNSLAKLRRDHPDRMIWSDRSSVLHGKFVIQDAEAALLTSYNFLNRSRQREVLEIGLHVAGIDPGRTTTAVLRLLRWARNNFPDYNLGQRVLTLPHDLDATELEPSTPETTPQRPTAEPEAIRHWAAEWRAAVEALVAERQRCQRSAELLVDRDHRDVLEHVLHHSSRRLAILSDKISIDVVDDTFTAALRKRLTEGVSCALMFQRQGATDLAAGPAAPLKRLVPQFPRLLSLNETSSHAKILVSDDEAVIGSFNFLSFGSDYTRSSRAERSELSFRVRDPRIVDAVLRALGDHWPAAFTPLLERRAPELVLPPVVAARPAIQPLFHHLQGGRSPGAVFLEWFAARPAPWSDLAALQDAGLAEPLLAQAVGAAVAGAADLERPEAVQWRTWLAEHRWLARDFVGSALLMPPDTTSPLGLTPWLARLAAAVAAPRLSAERPAALPTDAGPLEAAILLGVIDLLVHGSDALVPWLEQAAGQLPRHLERWARAALTFRARGLGALPIALLQRSMGRQARRQQIEATRDRFRKELVAAEAVSFKFSLGQHTWDRLKTPEYPLGKLRGLLDANDATGLGAYFADLAASNRDLERIMDAVSYELRDSHLDRIADPKRKICLSRLRQAEAAAHAWVDVAAAPTDPHEIFQLQTCRDVRAALADLDSVDTTPLTRLAEAVRGLARARLRPLLAAEDP